MICDLLCDVVRLVFYGGLCLCGISDRIVFVWFVYTVVCVVWFVFLLCVSVCLCGVVMLSAFVCFVCELLCDAVYFVFFFVYLFCACVCLCVLVFSHVFMCCCDLLCDIVFVCVVSVCVCCVLNVFVRFGGESMCAVVWFVVFCVIVSPQTNSFGGMSH